MGNHNDTGKNVLEYLSIPFTVNWPKELESGVNDVLFGALDVLLTAMRLAGL